MSRRETFSSRTSKIITQIKHPVICTQATQFVYIPLVHLHTAVDLQHASVYSPEATTSIMAVCIVSQVTCSHLYGLWRCDSFSFFIQRGYMAICHSFTLQTRRRSELHPHTCHPGRCFLCVGASVTAMCFCRGTFVCWKSSRRRSLPCEHLCT